MSDKVSIIIPAGGEVGTNYGERFLPHTVKDLLTKSVGDIEIIVVLDGYWAVDDNNNWLLPDRPNITVIHRSKQMGMRAAINAAAALAKGKYLMKCDAHCMFEYGFDEVLKADCDDDWIVIPRRHSLDAENWAIDQNGKIGRDYHYLNFPSPYKEHDHGIHGVEWPQRARERSEYLIDDTPSFQGSCWFMTRRHRDWLGDMSEEGYGTFSQEPQEIGNKTWLGGGRIVVNKKTWYAHLHKGKRYGRMYHQNGAEIVKAHNWSAWHWMTDKWKDRKYDFEWLIRKFWPMPTWEECWMEDWGKSLEQWKMDYSKAHPEVLTW